MILTIGLFATSLAIGGTRTADAVDNDREDQTTFESARAYDIFNAAGTPAEEAAHRTLIVVGDLDGPLDDATLDDILGMITAATTQVGGDGAKLRVRGCLDRGVGVVHGLHGFLLRGCCSTCWRLTCWRLTCWRLTCWRLTCWSLLSGRALDEGDPRTSEIAWEAAGDVRRGDGRAGDVGRIEDTELRRCV